MRSAECGVWKTRSVENAECGKCGVLKKNILKGYKKVKRKNKVISPHVLNYIRYNTLYSSGDWVGHGAGVDVFL